MSEAMQQQTGLRRTGGLWLLIPLLVVLVVVIVLSNKWSRMLNIERIIVEGARILSAKDVATMTGIQPQMSFESIDLFEVHRRLMMQPYIKSVWLSRQYPNTLFISIVEREPVAVLSESQLRYVDTDAVILPRIESTVNLDLPFITGISGVDSIHSGQKVDVEEMLRAIKILKTASAMGASQLISEVNMSNARDVQLYSTDGGVQIILGHDDYAMKFAKLQTFWNEFVKTSDVSRLVYIDLRYNGQVVVKWKKDGQRAVGNVQTKKTTS